MGPREIPKTELTSESENENNDANNNSNASIIDNANNNTCLAINDDPTDDISSNGIPDETIILKTGDEENVNDKPPQSRPLLVRKASGWRNNPDEDYKMTSATRGLCLIVNNVQFNLDVLPKRRGSDKDAFRFKTIFTQLGFEVDCKRNLNSDKMKNIFKQKAALCHNKHDALVVILLSHGTESGIYGVDGIEVDLNDILSQFDNKKCKPMRSKPKIFIIQACRGRQIDHGVRETQNFFSQPDTQPCSLPSQFTQFNSQVPVVPRWAEVDKDFQPTRTDMVLCFASQSGYVSTRNEEEGSWLGDSLAYHLVSQAHQRHLLEIFNMVSRDVRKRRSSEGLKQVLEITTIGFDKNLYFNPGLSDG